MLRAGELEDKEIEIETTSSGGSTPFFELPNMPGAVGAISLGDIFGKGAGKPTRRRLKVSRCA